MGLDFKAPRKDDREAWWILEILADNGVTFHGCGCDVGFEPPLRARETSPRGSINIEGRAWESRF